MTDSEDDTDAADAAEDGTGEADAAGDGSGGADAAADDDFDKEAERERLREKYEQDQERREATQQMSELLLKGATMTNKHCDACGSPVFRHDGEEFCPNCGGTAGMGEGADAGGEADDGRAEATPPDDAQRADASRQAGGRQERARRGAAGRGATPTAGRDDDRRTAGAPDERRGRATRADEAAELEPERALRPDPSELQAGADAGIDGRGADPGPSGGRAAERGTTPSGGVAGGTDEAPSLAQARASLRRAIVSLSEQAAQSDDPVRAKNMLEAAREGAEALAELGGDEV